MFEISVSPQGTALFPPDGILWNLKFGTFTKIRQHIIICLKCTADLCTYSFVLCFACMLSEPEWPKVVLATLGILGMSIAFPTVYLYSAELFPTVVRNVGVGTSSMCARFGSMVAPYITSLASSKHFHILLEIIILTDCKFQTSWKELSYLRSALSLILKGLPRSAVVWRRLQ